MVPPENANKLVDVYGAINLMVSIFIRNSKLYLELRKSRQAFGRASGVMYGKDDLYKGGEPRYLELGLLYHSSSNWDIVIGRP